MDFFQNILLLHYLHKSPLQKYICSFLNNRIVYNFTKKPLFEVKITPAEKKDKFFLIQSRGTPKTKHHTSNKTILKRAKTQYIFRTFS
ncbi:MAG: hypothetical protein ACI85O_002002 [Saprospiraceae bacterium]|jgi:hypothetical protein